MGRPCAAGVRYARCDPYRCMHSSIVLTLLRKRLSEGAFDVAIAMTRVG